MKMNKTYIYIIIAIFLALVVQPNISVNLKESVRIPENAQSPEAIMTNDTVDLAISESKSTICIDAAYGGSDLGYSEQGKLASKDITLQLSKIIGETLEQSGYNVVYTRTDDDINFYSNDEQNANYRINIAKDQKSDYLLHIDINSNVDSLVKGYTIFTQPDDKLINLSNTISQNFQSINYSQFRGLDSDHYGNFPILKDQDIPTISIEFGYITNPSDYTQITNEDYQKKIASSIAKAFLQEVN